MKDNIERKETKRNTTMLVALIALILAVAGGTLAYFAISITSNNITGKAGTIDLTLTVTRVLPADTTIEDIILSDYATLSDDINNKCVDDDVSLCQLYEVNLANSSSSVNVNVKGQVSFDNTNSPNLSWISLDYDSSKTYSSTDLPDTFNTASNTLTNFVDSYYLASGSSKKFYLLVWVNSLDEVQEDNGTYTGTVRFEDASGKGVTSTFSS